MQLHIRFSRLHLNFDRNVLRGCNMSRRAICGHYALTAKRGSVGRWPIAEPPTGGWTGIVQLMQ